LQFGAFEPLALNGAGRFDPLLDHFAGFTGAGATEFLEYPQS
jgi:hypothetical protein